MLRCTICVMVLCAIFVVTIRAEENTVLLSRKVASHLEARAGRVFDDVFGPGRVKVLVTVQMDCSRSEEIRVEATSGPARSRGTLEVKTRGGSRVHERSHYVVSRRVVRTISARPRVKRLTTLVFVGDHSGGSVDSKVLQAAFGTPVKDGNGFLLIGRQPPSRD